MESEDKNNEPFEILIFEGNDAASAAENMRIGLAAKFKQFIKEGRPMKPCGAPVVFKEDNFFKIMVLLWLDHAFLSDYRLSCTKGETSFFNDKIA